MYRLQCMIISQLIKIINIAVKHSNEINFYTQFTLSVKILFNILNHFYYLLQIIIFRHRCFIVAKLFSPKNCLGKTNRTKTTKLCGMYSLAIWSPSKKSLSL